MDTKLSPPAWANRQIYGVLKTVQRELQNHNGSSNNDLV
jgi:hypothetical protein